jgi:tRNA-dihydrouridine synthase A
MIGRSAYHNPTDILAQADRRIYGTGQDTTPEDVVAHMLPYIDAHLDQGGRLNQITRHMMGLFAGRTGARVWRRTLSEQASRPGADRQVLLEALDAMQTLAEAQETV